MIFAQYKMVPGRKHPDFGRIGAALVNCWLRVRSFEAAKMAAAQFLREEGWKSLALQEIWRIPPGHFKEPSPGFECFEQAQTDRTVFVIYTCPLYPVYCVEFEAFANPRNRRKYAPGTRARAKYWVVNEKVSRTADCFDDFWGKPIHQRRAVNMGKRRIEAEGWQVTLVTSHYPASSQTNSRSKLLTQYYDEAEETGDCLAFWVE